MPPYPIDLDMTGRSALVVGLGAVGRRKAEGLIAAGARVVGVDPGPIGTIEGVEVRKEAYDSAHLRGISLAFAAATPEVNRRVVLDAGAAGIWVNSASEPESGDFSVPAVWRDGPIALSVSTSGASPALAALLRDRASAAIGPGAAVLANVLMDLRRDLLASVADPSERRRLLASWADPSWLEMAEDRGREAVEAALKATVPRPS